MFGYCLWYKINNDHQYHKIIQELSKRFETCIYEPHFTIKTSMTLDEAEKIYKEYQNKTYPVFKQIGDVYQTKFKNFYALQQNFIDIHNQKLYHISLVYNLDKAFSDDDIIYVNNLRQPELLSKDLKISIFRCDSIYASDWKKIK
jgi:hypothetical protein